MAKTVFFLFSFSVLLVAIAASVVSPERAAGPISNGRNESDDLSRSNIGGDDTAASTSTDEFQRAVQAQIYELLKVAARGIIGLEEPEYPPYCRCRPLITNKNAVCYDMFVPLQEHGRCRKRSCGTKYECVPGGGKDLKTCMRRIARYETKLLSDYTGVPLCFTYKLEQQKVFYTHYP